MSKIQHFYKTVLVGQSGCGKTTSAQNLDRATTGFINIENKPLPFKGDFKYHVIPKNVGEFEAALIEFGKNPEITSIYVDSLSAIFDMVLLQARKQYKGFDIWNFYNETIQKILDLIKRVPKEMFISAHYEILGIEGSQEKRIKVKGKEWESVIEREFTIVLYGNKRFDEKGKVNYYFNLVEDGASAKCPPGLFGENTTRIPNDCKMILDAIQEFKK
jgi:hypothetical protein